MALEDMILFNKQVQLVATEHLAVQLKKFNEASGMTLIMSPGYDIGDYIEQASYKIIKDLVNRRDVYTHDTVTDTKIMQHLDKSIKIDSRIGPVLWEIEQFVRLGKDESEAGLLIGEQAAEAVLLDYLNIAAGSLIKGMQSKKQYDTADIPLGSTYVDNSDGTADVYMDVVKEVSNTKPSPTLLDLNSAAAMFGDRSSSLTAWLMNGVTFHEMIGSAITNTERLFKISDVSVVSDALGRRYVVSDIPSLTSNEVMSVQAVAKSATQRTFVLGLTVGSAVITHGAIRSGTEDVLGYENLGKRWQAEYSYQLALKGYSWKSETGGASPTTAEILNHESWEPFNTSRKDSAGVLIACNH